MKRRFFTVLALSLAFVAVLAGCRGKAGTGKPDSKELFVIRIPDTYSPTSMFTPYIAAEKGFYEEQGIKPLFTGVISSAQHVAAVVAGDNDVGNMHINRTLSGIAAGAKIKAVVADTETSKELPHMEYIVLDSSSLRSPVDMVGKKIGIGALGGCNEYTPYEILKKYGITEPETKVEIVVVPSGNEELALRNGDVDVIGYHGHPEDIFSHGNARVLFDDYEIWGTEGGGAPYYFREDFINKNPDAVRRFVAAHVKTIKWINENREEARRVQAEHVGVPAEKVTIFNFVKDGIITESSIAIWADILKSHDEFPKDIAVKSIYTNEFVEGSPDYRFK